jgi:hypothetical protein
MHWLCYGHVANPAIGTYLREEHHVPFQTSRLGDGEINRTDFVDENWSYDDGDLGRGRHWRWGGRGDSLDDHFHRFLAVRLRSCRRCFVLRVRLDYRTGIHRSARRFSHRPRCVS